MIPIQQIDPFIVIMGQMVALTATFTLGWFVGSGGLLGKTMAFMLFGYLLSTTGAGMTRLIGGGRNE